MDWHKILIRLPNNQIARHFYSETRLCWHEFLFSSFNLCVVHSSNVNWRFFAVATIYRQSIFKVCRYKFTQKCLLDWRFLGLIKTGTCSLNLPPNILNLGKQRQAVNIRILGYHTAACKLYRQLPGGKKSVLGVLHRTAMVAEADGTLHRGYDLGHRHAARENNLCNKFPDSDELRSRTSKFSMKTP